MSHQGYIDRQKQLVWFWAPKCGATTLLKLLKMNEYNLNRGHIPHSSSPFNECLQYIQDYNFSSIVFCRNPITRIISCFINKFVLYKNKPIYYRQDLENFSREFFDIFRKEKGFPQQEDRVLITFEDFLDIVSIIFQRQDNSNNRTVNHHWDTQVSPALLSLIYDYIVPMEDFQDSIQYVASIFGVQVGNIHANKTNYTNQITSEYLGAIPSFFIDRSQLRIENFLTENNKRKIKNLYLHDFEMFGYNTNNIYLPPKNYKHQKNIQIQHRLNLNKNRIQEFKAFLNG